MEEECGCSILQGLCVDCSDCKYVKGVRRIRAALALFQVGDNPPMATDGEIGWVDALEFALTALGTAAKAVVEKEAGE